MAAHLATVTLGVQWTPPAAQTSSGNSAYTTQLQYNGQNVGELDIPTTIAPATVVPIPFGNVAQVKCLIIRNSMSQDVGIRINGAVADTFRLASGAEFVVAMPTAPSGAPLGLITSASVTVLTAPLVIEQCQFFVFGD